MYSKLHVVARALDYSRTLQMALDMLGIIPSAHGRSRPAPIRARCGVGRLPGWEWTMAWSGSGSPMRQDRAAVRHLSVHPWFVTGPPAPVNRAPPPRFPEYSPAPRNHRPGHPMADQAIPWPARPSHGRPGHPMADQAVPWPARPSQAVPLPTRPSYCPPGHGFGLILDPHATGASKAPFRALIRAATAAGCAALPGPPQLTDAHRPTTPGGSAAGCHAAAEEGQQRRLLLLRVDW